MNTLRCRLLSITIVLFSVSCCVGAVDRESFFGFTATSTICIEFDYANYAVDTTYPNNVLVTINGAAEPMTDGEVILSGTNVSLTPHSFTKPNGGQNHSISATFTNTNGTATAYATIYKHLTDDPHEHFPIRAEQTVNVCKITNISGGVTDGIEGTATPQRTKAYAAIATLGMGSYYPYTVPIIAELTPTPSGSMPPNFITWSGGTGYVDEVAYNTYHEPKNSSHKSTIKATCGTSDYSMNVYIIWANVTAFRPDAQNPQLPPFKKPDPDHPDQGGDDTYELGAEIDMPYVAMGNEGAVDPPVTVWGNTQTQFTVYPSELITDGNNGIIDKTKVKFHCTRYAKDTVYRKLATGWERYICVTGGTDTWSNNDYLDDITFSHVDEDNDPWDGSGHLYANDSPWVLINGEEPPPPFSPPGTPPTPADPYDGIGKKMNTMEYVEIKLGGGTAINSNNRCSDYNYWHFFGFIERGADGKFHPCPSLGWEMKQGNIFWGALPLLKTAPYILPNNVVGANIVNAKVMDVTGGITPITWSVINGQIPPGLTFNTTTGVMSGILTTAGIYTFTVKAEDSNNPKTFQVQSATWTIN